MGNPVGGAGGGSPSPGAGSPAPVSTPSAEPKITFGGGMSGPGVTKPSEPAAPSQETEKVEPFEFEFEGDPEKYREKIEAEGEKAPEGAYDAAKPFDPNLREALKDKPELLKAAERNHFELRRWQQSGFKTPQEVTQFRTNVETLAKSLGRTDNLQGLEAIKAEASEWASVMKGFQAGDPAVVEQWFADNPEGMSKLMGPALIKFSESNPAAFSHELSKIVMATLNTNDQQGTSVIGAFNQLVDMVGNDPKAAKLLNRMHATFQQLFDAAQKAPTSTGIEKNPQLEAREKALQQQEKTAYENTVGAQGRPIVDKAIEQGIAKAFPGRKFAPDVKADLVANIHRLLVAAQSADSDYQKNARDLLSAKDTEGFMRTLKASIARNLPGVLRKQMRIFQGFSGSTEGRKAEGNARVESGAGVTSGGPQKMRYTGPLFHGGPPPDQIDYAAMRSRFGRQETSEMLNRREFLKKGDSKTIWQW